MMQKIVLTVLFMFISVVSFSQDTTEIDSSYLKMKAEAEEYFNKAADFSYDDNIDSAMHYFFKTLEIFEAIDDQKRRLIVMANIGLIYSNFDMLPQSFEYYQKALNLGLALNDSVQTAWIYYLLGIANMNANAFDVAGIYLDKSRGLYQSLKDTSDLLMLEAVIAKNNFDKSKSKGLDEMIKANMAQEAALKKMRVEDFMIVDYISSCYSFVSDFYYVLSRLKDDRLSKYYSQTMKDFYDGCQQYEEYMPMFSSRQKIAHAYVLMAGGGMKKAALEIQRIEDRDTPEFYGLMYEFCRKSGDYAGALEYAEKREKCERTVFNSETSIKYERNRAQEEYEDKLERHAAKVRNEHRDFLQRQRMAEIRQKFFVAILIFLALFLTVLFLFGIYQIYVSNSLKNSNSEILKFNSGLKIKNRDILAQKIALQNLKEQIESNSYDLKRLNSYLSNSILMAQDIQKAIMPDAGQMTAFFGECFVYWKPKNIVSGDFYWTTERGGKKYLITADCTGHGVPGALLSILGISILSDIAAIFAGLNAGEILDLFKERFVRALNQNNFLDDGMELSLIILGGDRTLLQYSGAKRPLYIVREHEITKYAPDLLSIGHNIGRENIKFTNYEIKIKKGDMLYTFSDGIPDQMGGDTGFEKFSLPVLRELLSEISVLSPQQQCRIIDGAIESHVSACKKFSVPQTDDQLMIGIRV
jgi:serine phosphatase RsbU (regulator of sigma subunit)